MDCVKRVSLPCADRRRIEAEVLGAMRDLGCLSRARVKDLQATIESLLPLARMRTSAPGRVRACARPSAEGALAERDSTSLRLARQPGQAGILSGSVSATLDMSAGCPLRQGTDAAEAAR